MNVLQCVACVSGLVLLGSMHTSHAFAAVEPDAVTLNRELAPGMRLYAINGSRVGPFAGRSVVLAAGENRIELRYSSRDNHSPVHIVAYDFSCNFPSSGTFTLRSDDNRFTQRQALSRTPVPAVWIETNGQRVPACTRLGS